ncbi:MAG: PIG-L deacetylase family protein [Acidobacteriota bacterium]
MRILALGCHPDDIEFGCGGTLIKYALAGHQVSMMVLTEGQAGGDGDARRQEQEKAARFLKCAQLYWGNYKDTEVPLTQASIQRIEDVIADVQPDFIFVHFGDDTHQDHRNLAASTVTATRYTRNVLFYEGPTTQNFTPTVFVDVSEVMQAKIQALEAHASQVGKTNIGDLNIVDLARAAALFRGTQARVRNAEGFMPLRLFINVVSGD